MKSLIFVFCLLCASPALALSCLRPDVVELYQRVLDDEAVYTFARGRILLEGPLNLPARGEHDLYDPKPVETRAQFVGIALSADGFDQAYIREIVIEARCVSVWCGGLQDGEVFVALSHEDQDRRLALGPCGGDQILVTREGEARLLACHLTGRCQLAE